MAQYARELPVDKNNNPYSVSIPGQVSNQSWGSVFTVSSTIGLNANTTAIQLVALGNPANFKWGPSSVTATNFDGTIPVNTPQMFVVPQSVAGVYPSIQGANAANGLYNQISIKQVGGAGSVFGAEF